MSNVHRKLLAVEEGMKAFGGIAPLIAWDFHSHMLGAHMMFSFMLTDNDWIIRICRHCMKAFAASSL